MKENSVDLLETVAKTLDAPYRRVTPCQTRLGKTFWLKRVERSAPHLWLVKGRPRKAFERDLRSHRMLWRAGLPVPAILLDGHGFFAVEDAGESLTAWCQTPWVSRAEKYNACRAAGRALAHLHSANVAHGRPAFRDMCWDGQRIRFIDFEYFVPTSAGLLGKARDLGVAVLSALSQGTGGFGYALGLLSAYRAARRRRRQTLVSGLQVSTANPVSPSVGLYRQE